MIKGEVVPLLGKWILIKYWSAAGGAEGCVKEFKADFFQQANKGEVVPLLGKWILKVLVCCRGWDAEGCEN